MLTGGLLSRRTNPSPFSSSEYNARVASGTNKPISHESPRKGEVFLGIPPPIASGGSHRTRHFQHRDAPHRRCILLRTLEGDLKHVLFYLGWYSSRLHPALNSRKTASSRGKKAVVVAPFLGSIFAPSSKVCAAASCHHWNLRNRSVPAQGRCM